MNSIMIQFMTLTYFFFFHPSSTTTFYTLSLHDALPICVAPAQDFRLLQSWNQFQHGLLHIVGQAGADAVAVIFEDRKSTRLNSSHITISYAVFCLKKKILHNNNVNNVHFKTKHIFLNR